jgi:peptidoglycan/LPS O-acetylase OafA/YrhL
VLANRPKLSLRRTKRGAQTRQSPTASSSSFVIPSLDGIRALSVGVVFFVHAGIGFSPGPLGVTIFFFLSGFLITTLLRMEFEKTGRISLRNFYLRRAFRLLPPLYLVLGAAFIVTLLGAYGAQKLRLGACLAQVFFLSNFQILSSGWDGPHTGRPPGTGNLWSLAVEEHFYLLFPLLYLVLSRKLPSPRRQAAILGGLCALVLAWRFVLILGFHSSFDRTYAATDTRIDSILFGCILAIVANPVLDRAKLFPANASTLRRAWAPVLAPFGLAAMLVLYWMHDTRITGTVQYTIDGLALVPFFVAAIHYHDRGIFRAFNWRPVMWVGAVSYSIYILHEPLIAAVHDRVPGGQMVHGLVYLTLTLLAAWAIFRWVERPFARLRRRLSRVSAKDAPRQPAEPAKTTADGRAPEAPREVTRPPVPAPGIAPASAAARVGGA